MSAGRTTAQATSELLAVRVPTTPDGIAMWQLAKDSGTLELNSAYAYVLWCDRFAASSALAEEDQRPAGFVMGFRPPTRPDTLFVWQVAVDEAFRGRGLARRMIESILERDPGLRYLEATVAPSNAASQRLFRSLARKAECQCRETPYFTPEHFPAGDHEPETLFRIGPLSGQSMRSHEETD